MTVFTFLPPALTAGDNWVLRDEAAFKAYPAPEWHLSWVLWPLRGNNPIRISGIWVDDNAHTARLSASDTASFAAGAYSYSITATNDATDERKHIASGRIEVLPNPDLAPAFSLSHAERMLAAIEATLEGRASKDADSYTIEGRSISRTPIEALQKLRAQYRAEVKSAHSPKTGKIRHRRASF